MKKTVFILLFISNFTLSSQWKQHGNSESIKAHDTAIKDFVITEDSKYIYTLDSKGLIKKWDYATGDSLSAVKAEKTPNQYTPSNWCFLSSDAKTFCVISFFIDNSLVFYSNILVFDIETGKSIDSICSYILYKYSSDYPAFNGNFIDYMEAQKMLIVSFNYSYTNQYQVYSWEDSGRLQIFSKGNNNWKILQTHEGGNKLTIRNNDKLYVTNYAYSGYKGVGPDGQIHSYSSVWNFIINISKNEVFSLNAMSLVDDSTNYDIIKMIGFTFNSGYFSSSNNNLIMNNLNTIFKFNLIEKTIDSIHFNLYPFKNNMRMINFVDEAFFLFIDNKNLHIYSFNDLKYYNTIIIDSIDQIVFSTNSFDKQYIFFTNTTGKLLRVKNTEISKLRANYISPDTNVCINDTVHFFDRSLGYPGSYFWDFGDGYVSNEKDPVHFYTKTGYYNIRLIVTKNGVCDTINKKYYINVLPELKAAFIYDYITSMPGKVNFSNKSSGIIDSVLWFFDDSTFSKNPTVSHTYTCPDKYNVKLKVFSKNLTDSVSKIIPIYNADKAIDKSRIQYEFTDTTHEGEALKGWEDEGDYLVYHIKRAPSMWHHGAFRNFMPEWNVSTTINKEFLVRQSGGTYSFLSDTSITNFDKYGTILHSGNYRNSNDLNTVKNSGNSIITTYFIREKFIYDEIENGEKTINSTMVYNNYSFINNDFLYFTIYYYDVLYSKNTIDYYISYTYTRDGYPSPYTYYLFQINNNSFPSLLKNKDFIRINSSTLVIAGDEFLVIALNPGLKKDSIGKTNVCTFKPLKKLPDYSFNSLLKLNDTAFVAAGSYKGSPAYVVANANGAVIDSLVISERTGSFNYVSLTPDNNLLLSGYRKKYYHYNSPYFVKTDDKLINSLLTSVYDPGELQPNPAIYGLKCSPNPVTGKATVSFDLKEDAPVGFKVFDLYGNCVISGKAGDCPAGANTFDVSFDSQPIGCYFLVLEANGSTCSEKIVYLRE